MVENNVELATSTKTETGFHERGYTHLGLVGMGYVTTLFYALCYKKKKKNHSMLETFQMQKESFKKYTYFKGC